MKIIDKRFEYIDFSDIAVGSIFTTDGGECFIKTQIMNRLDNWINAINLKSGQECTFRQSEKIVPVETELIIVNPQK